MLILFITRNEAEPFETAGNKYFVRDSKEAALLFASIKNSTPGGAVIAHLFDVNFASKNITEVALPKVVFGLE